MSQRNPERKSDVPLILVTGAAGCVGTFVVEQLLARGYKVRAVDRPGADLPQGPADRLQRVPADLTDPAVAESLVAGAEGIVHTAAVVDISQTLAQLRPINVDAVARLYDAAAAAGSRTFIHFSTGSLYHPQDRPLSEDDPLLAQNDYGLSKLLSEDLLREREGRGPVVNILRPALIFGPRGRVLLNLFAAFPPVLQQLSRVALPFSGGPTSNYVYAPDVAGAAVHLLEHPQPHGATFNIANDDPIAAGDMITATLEGYGMRVAGPAIPLPKLLFRATRPIIDRELVFRTLNRSIERVWRRIREQHGLSAEFAPAVPREMLDFLCVDTVFDNRRIKQAGYTLRYPRFAEPWRETLQWFIANRWIPELRAAA